MRKTLFTAFLMVLTFLSYTVFAGEGEFKYVGAKKCKTCHNTTKSGKQYDIWAAGPHAKAFEALSNEKSLEFAKKNNIADPAKDANCLKCHSTAASVDKSLLEATITIEEGVSCESCHGPGSEYKSMKIMKDHEASLANGLIVPDEKLCVTCHNESNPFHKPFDYKAASAKIAHPTPK
ncbi:MAG: cytochrome c family protein [Calditrichaceae bacterium]